MDRPWFDSETNTLLLDEYVAEMPSFKKILRDGIVTQEEVTEQSNKVIGLLKKAEEMLSPEERAVVTDLLCELSVLYALSQKSLIDRH